ncbi:MAG: beta-ketoacyl-ACP synthase II [Chitinophagales bacterium]|nr:beta-ketoacyl-ACP synthase II [Chitinophagales bacterium]MCB9031662.1 beta-ketoacyl-ACP synthase II [Chitinophagales bacterium]HPE97346.1 beta-ketoacyl-ACP synthase II [Chitinophagales bacterium]HQU40107.1 beta-ketoacyl-ACP synthase II [Chitinophagales bacterium]HRX25040.1 beta-ketoacyl-ACP synthase II [Chitinophagales bacterium]
MSTKRVVVTGLGALTPLGNSVQEYWAGLAAGRSGADFITRFDAEKFKTRFACEVKNFDPTSVIDKKEVRRMDPYLHYAMAAVEEGVQDAGLTAEGIDHDKVGVIWASGIGGLKTFEEEVSSFAQGDGTPRFNPFFIPKMISDIAAGMISIRYGFRGPNYATVSACASSTHALIAAFDAIRLGRAKVVVAGGSEAAVTASGVGGFNAMKALSERNDDPKTASRPFDVDRDGFVLGEGAGCVIVEDYEHAVARGAKIYCELAGGGMSADAYHMTAPHPDGIGATLVMRDALRDAGMQTTDIDYVNVHGTSTPLGDPQEIKAIEAVFGEHAYNMNISSTKSMTGHLLGAAGAIEAIAGIMAMQHSLVPPTINHFTDDPVFDTRLNLTFNTAQPRTLNAVLSNTFGFGGHNASVIFRKIS